MTNSPVSVIILNRKREGKPQNKPEREKGMESFYYENTTVCGGVRGTDIHEISIIEIIGNKNGVQLKQITITETSKVKYELYLDGDLKNVYYNLKTAKAMFKDFSA